MNEIISKLTQVMVPELYSKLDETQCKNINLVLRGRDYIISRQMMAVCDLDEIQISTEIIESVRKQIAEKHNAIYVIREIGLQIVLFVNKFDSSHLEELQADKYAYSAVIIQGLHIVSVSGGQVHSVNSQWGKLVFGKGKRINTLLSSIV